MGKKKDIRTFFIANLMLFDGQDVSSAISCIKGEYSKDKLEKPQVTELRKVIDKKGNVQAFYVTVKLDGFFRKSFTSKNEAEDFLKKTQKKKIGTKEFLAVLKVTAMMCDDCYYNYSQIKKEAENLRMKQEIPFAERLRQARKGGTNAN